MHRVLDDVLDQRRIIAGTVDVRPRKSDVRVLLRDIGNQMRAYVGGRAIRRWPCAVGCMPRTSPWLVTTRYLAPRSRIELRVDPVVPPAAMVNVTRVRQILANVQEKLQEILIQELINHKRTWQHIHAPKFRFCYERLINKNTSNYCWRT